MGGRGSSGGKASTIISKNDFGQELKIPRKTFEDRLKNAEDYKKRLMEQDTINPNDLRRAQEQIDELKETLKTGRTKEARANENNYQFSKMKTGTQVRLPNGSTAYKFPDGKWGIHSNGADWTTQEAIKASTSDYGKFTNREMNKLLKLQTKKTKR